ncbi:MAG TPA: hypothetical protein VMY98_08075, partial [Anaerolineae bacterium]|nr:hypothetical protein [Anaerolineae bacterium]
VELASIVVIGGVSLPLAALFSYPFWTNEVFRIWREQSLTTSPHLVHFLWGYGLSVPLAAVGAKHVWQEKRDAGLLLVAWILAAGLLLYLPGLPGRRFAQGLIIPWGCLAALGMEELFRKRRTDRRIRFTYLFILGLGLVSSTIMLARETQSVLDITDPTFRSGEQILTINWLKHNTGPQETVLSGPHTGSYVPAAIGHRVFWGHWCETIHLEEKTREFTTFFDGATSHEWRRNFLRRYGIRYLLYEPQGLAWGTFRPSEASYLTERFRAGDYAVYEVAQTPGE